MIRTMYIKFVIPILLFCCLSIFGQTKEDVQTFWRGKEVHNIVPLSPEAESFDRVKDIPVNMYDGRLDFKIPLYTVKSGDISLPITLEYEGTAIPGTRSNMGRTKLETECWRCYCFPSEYEDAL